MILFLSIPDRLSFVKHLSNAEKHTTIVQEYSKCSPGFSKVTTLANGLRIASESTPGHFGAVGVYVDAGSRYETEKTRGVSHILDRLAFKVQSSSRKIWMAQRKKCRLNECDLIEHNQQKCRRGCGRARVVGWQYYVFIISRSYHVSISNILSGPGSCLVALCRCRMPTQHRSNGST